MTQVKIARLAQLSALKPDNDIEIEGILDSFEAIESVDTSCVKSVSRSGNASMKPRADEVVTDEKIPDELLACSPQKVAAHQVVLSGIMHGE